MRGLCEGGGGRDQALAGDAERKGRRVYRPGGIIYKALARANFQIVRDPCRLRLLLLLPPPRVPSLPPSSSIPLNFIRSLARREEFAMIDSASRPRGGESAETGGPFFCRGGAGRGGGPRGNERGNAERSSGKSR